MNKKVDSKKDEKRIKFCVDRKIVVWKRQWFFWDGDEEFEEVKDYVVNEFLNDPAYFHEEPGSKISWFDEEDVSDEVVLDWYFEEQPTCELYIYNDWDGEDDWIPTEDNTPFDVRRERKLGDILGVVSYCNDKRSFR